MQERRKRTNAQAPIRRGPSAERDNSSRMDLAKVARLRALVEQGHFGIDFEDLVDRLAHAMRP